ASEQAAGDRADREHEEEREWIEWVEKTEEKVVVVRPVRDFGHRRRQRLAVNHADHARDSGGYAAGEIAALEARHDGLVDDAPRGDVGQCAFEAIADLDPQLVIVYGDHQERTVVDLPAADLPGFRRADRVLLDRLR